MSISYSPQGSVALAASPDSYSQVPLIFAGVDAGGRPFNYRADLTARGISYDATLQGVPAVYFPSSIRTPLRETADRFSALDIRGELAPLVATIHERFKFIKGLSLVAFGGVSVIFAETTMYKEKLPLGVVSNGIERLLNVLLGIAASTNGIVLVDELDSCVHHSKFGGVWEALRDFSKTYSTQLFVSTHSAEWLTALLPVIKGHEQDFSLLRTDVIEGDVQHTVEHFTGSKLGTAIAQNAEIRN